MTRLPITALPSGTFNMADYCIGAAARAVPDKVALTVISDIGSQTPSEQWTFSELQSAVLRTTSGLKALGLSRGDRILIRLDNTSTYAILYFAAIAGGFVPLPTSSQLTDVEARFLLTDSGAKVVAMADHLSIEGLDLDITVLSANDIETMMKQEVEAHYANTNAEDPAYLIYTSGTTSKPKGVLHAHRVAFGRSPTYQGWYGLRHDDRMLHAGAFNWTYTLGTGLIDPWANGASTIIFTGDKSPEVWPTLIRKTGATLFAAVPSLFRQVLKYAPPGPIDVGALRHGFIAGESPPPDLFDHWYARTGTHLYEALGMSEISTYISTAPGMTRKPGSAGKPQPGRRIAILNVNGGTDPLPAGEEGLIAIHRSDKGLMLGYWNRDDEEAEVYRGDWFIGGDLGSIDEDGYVTHLGRANDVIKALGYRVSPLEVEAALLQHPEISDIACAAIQVRPDVTVIGAFIVASSATPPSRESIIAFAEARLARYKVPREILFVEALPRTHNGKIQRSALQNLYAQLTTTAASS